MNIKSYSAVTVELIRSTLNPAELIDVAASHCLKQPKDIGPGTAKDSLISYLLSADHGNPLEHCSYTFRVNGFSRSGLAQLTRHRMASYTVSSQHYQEYSEYPFVVNGAYKHFREYEEAFEACLKCYHRLLKNGVPKEEARQVLPNAMGCGFVMTINARSLVNFLRLRLCKRNCAEILNLAWELKYAATAHFPMLWEKVHTMCIMDGKCNQGIMSCGRPYEKA
jgi:thymidylate synthase (FAD)